MDQVESLKQEWLYTHKVTSEFYDDNDDDEWVPYSMWLVMRSDDTINPSVIISGERNSDGTWNTTVDDGTPKTDKQKRKKEILLEIDRRGHISPVLEDNKVDNDSQKSEF